MTNEVKIVTMEEAEEADIMVCSPLDGELMFPDNGTGICSKCGKPVQFRPDAPKTPTKICLPCAIPKMIEDGQLGDLTIHVTAKTANEVKEYYKRKNTN